MKNNYAITQHSQFRPMLNHNSPKYHQYQRQFNHQNANTYNYTQFYQNQTNTNHIRYQDEAQRINTENIKNDYRYFKRERKETIQKQYNKSVSPSKPITPNINKVEKNIRKTQQQIDQYSYGEKYQYQSLHDKLNKLQNKMNGIKKTIQEKRKEKKQFIQNEVRNIVKIQQENKKEKGYKNVNILKGFVTQVPMHKQLHTFQFNPYSPRHNSYYVSEIVRAYKQERSIAREHLISSMKILKIFQKAAIPTKEQISSKMLKLEKRPGYQYKKTIIFDLDQTLIHCNQSAEAPSDVILTITLPTGQQYQTGINVRPYSFELLENLSKNYQIIIFTASHSCYANVVLDYLDPQSKYIHHRLYREHCYASPEGMYVKDLRIINRQFSDMVLIDNAAYSYAYQIENGIPIIPYYEGKIDYQLKALQIFLESLFLVKDVREVIKKTFKIGEYTNYDDPQTLVQQLYTQEFN